jgi:hypothetical protein
MKVQINPQTYKLFDELVEEYFHELNIFHQDPTEYHKKSDFLLGSLIDPSSKEELEEIENRQKNKIHTVRQLHKNNKTVEITKTIAEKITSNNQLNLVNSESCALVDRAIFSFINKIICRKPTPVEFNSDEILKEVLNYHIKELKDKYFKYEFKFPVHIIGLEKSLPLYENISLEKEENSTLEIKTMEKYMFSRAFEPNFNICISSSIKTSHKYSEERAIRANDATLNGFLVLYGFISRDNSWNSPIIKMDDYKQHHFSYFLSGKKGGALNENTLQTFSHNNRLCKDFWEIINSSFSEQAKLYKLLFSIPNRIMSNPNFDKSICSIIERSLKWFSDAIDEKNREIKIVKLTIAIESLVNFKSDAKKADLENDRFKETFVNRVVIINNFDDDVKRKAQELYNGRSSIAHGSLFKKGFNFDIIQFTATTILNSIILFSRFKTGLEETGFNKVLPEFIDSLFKSDQPEKQLK